MKRVFIFVTCLMLVSVAFNTSAQITRYRSHSGELIFSFANYNINGQKINTPVRFTCFFHASTNWHMDLGRYIGFYSGIGIRNVGFTSTHGDTMWKRRNYYIGVPLAIKIGDLNNDTYLYGGVEEELGLNYKEKLFIADKKISKFNAWFNDRTPLFMPSAFVGLNFKRGWNIRFRYYFNNFLRQDYTENGIKPYANTTSNIYYFSLSLNVRQKPNKKVVVTNKGV